MRKSEWKIRIPAALHRVIQEERPDSCEPVALKFVVHLLTLIRFSDVVLKPALRTMYLVFSRRCYVRTLFGCDCSSFLFYFAVITSNFSASVEGWFVKLWIGKFGWQPFLSNLFTQFILRCRDSNTHESNQSNPCFGRYSNRAPRNTGLEPYPLSDMIFRLLLMRLEQLLQPQIS